MSIYKLMQDPKAAEIYASLDAHIHPGHLSNDYLQAKLAGDKSLCLALECYIRDLARMHFHRPEVLDALSSMERHKSMRKKGTSAPKALQSIADSITAMYAAGDYDRLDNGRIKFFITTPRKYAANPGLLKISCKDSAAAVALVVAKYRAGMPKSRARYGTERRI